MANTFALHNILYGIKTYGALHEKKDPFVVLTQRWGNDVCVSANGFYKLIPMKDKWWWNFTGTTWEGEVRKAQSDAFETAYGLHRDEEEKNYQVERLK